MSNHHIGRNVSAVAFLEQLDRSSEFTIAGRFRVTTRSGSEYLIDDDAGTIQRNDDQPKPGRVQGATFGGSMLMSGRLLVDALMEFVMDGEVYTSSRVVTIEPQP